jgi:hypothetical protein
MSIHLQYSYSMRGGDPVTLVDASASRSELGDIGSKSALQAGA